MSLNSLKDLLIHELRDMFSAEQQLVSALPKLAQNANDSSLKDALNEHLKETQNQVDRLRTMFNKLGVSPQGETCEAMEGLIREAEEVCDQEGERNTKDAAIIAAAQRVEHYEIAGYGSAKAFAKALDLDDVVDLIDESLREEQEADRKLNKIAMGGLLTEGINERARVKG